MRLDPDQLEWIVREVVRRLQENMLRSPPLGGEGLGVRAKNDQQAARHTELTLPARVVTLAQLDGQLNGVARLHVAPDAVVTPAARDLLNQRGIELVRVEQT